MVRQRLGVFSAHMPDIPSIVRRIDDALPEMARAVIRAHLDLDDESNRAFLSDPDGREQHQTHWHQWGIITHTRIFLRHFDIDIPRYLRDWDLWEQADRELSVRIDGASRWSLLRISILLHDIGKFAARTRGRQTFHFMRHESVSGEIVRNELELDQFELTPAQIEYVALSAEDHFVLGHLRKRARADGVFDTVFTESRTFVGLAEVIKQRHPFDYVEIGVLFLGDSLAKTDPISGPGQAVSQYEVNIAAARRYLEVVLREPSL